MASIVGAPNALEVRLSELAGFGLGRPANVLFSEYVKVLVAQGAIDAETAERLSIGFYAAHYGDLETEDRRVSEAIARLQDVIARLVAMPLDARLELSLRVQCDLRTLSENVVRSAVTKPPIAPEPAWEAPPPAAADGRWDPEPTSNDLSNEFADEGLIPSVAVRSADIDLKRRRLRRVTLLMLAAFGLFFAGYASSGPIKKFLRPDGNEFVATEATRENPKVIERPPSKESLLRNWAVAEAGADDQKASLAYELLLAYQPKDALTLNNLAWLYLTTQDAAVHNPLRGLELSKRAISLRPSAEFLDTAAEAHFQTGNPQEAVKLEKEALQATPVFQRGLEALLRRQLQKFEAACKSQSPSSSTPSRDPAPKKTPARFPAAI
jgi:tetratricopeptide (TPR) repeat protein